MLLITDCWEGGDAFRGKNEKSGSAAVDSSLDFLLRFNLSLPVY